MSLLALDLGTSYTSVYKEGDGLIFYEPTVIAVKNKGEEYCFGREAKKLIGKTSENVSIIFPVFEGVIVDFDACVKLIKYIKSKVVEKTFFPQRVKLLMTVSCGISVEEKLNYEKAAIKAGFNEVFLLDCPLSSAMGLNDYVINDYTPVFIADIGGGVTDLAVLNMSGIISGSSLTVGGNNVDTGIIDYIIGDCNIKTGLLTAEKIKNEIGSLYPNDNNSMMISGRDVKNGSPSSMLISSKNINNIIEYYYEKILDVAESMLNALPPEVSADVIDRGIYLCGGGSNVLGIERYFYKRLKIPVIVAKEPYHASIMGAGKIISDKKLFEKFTGLR